VKPPFVVEYLSCKFPELAPEEIEARLRYDTFVNIEKKYMYFAVRKAACTSMKALIHRLENLPPIFALSPTREVRRDMFIHNRDAFRLNSILNFSDEEQQRILGSSDFFRFTMVRNPYTRLESAWRDKVRLCAPNYEYMYYRLKDRLPRPGEIDFLISFDEFVKEIATHPLDQCDPHWRRQSDHLFYPAINFTHVGKMEEFATTERKFLEFVGAGENQRDEEKRNVSGKASEYTPRLVEIAKRLYERDFAAFGYDANDPPPQRQAGEGPLSCRCEDQFLAEIIERNIIMGVLYKQKEAMQKELYLKAIEDMELYENLTFPEVFKNYISTIEGWLGEPEARLLYESARSVRSGSIVELGSYRGRSAAALAFGTLAGNRRPVFCLDPHEEFEGPLGASYSSLDRGRFMQEMLRLGLYHIVRLVNLSSEQISDHWPSPVALLWIDGDHHYEAVKRDWLAWSGKLAPDAVVIFDDADLAESGPGRVIDEIVGEGAYRVTKRVGKAVRIERVAGPTTTVAQ
jgi:hypothetical protein